MNELGDRLVLMIVAITGLLALVVGLAGGLVEAELSGVPELALYGVLAVLFLGILAAIWRGFDRID